MLFRLTSILWKISSMVDSNRILIFEPLLKFSLLISVADIVENLDLGSDGLLSGTSKGAVC